MVYNIIIKNDKDEIVHNFSISSNFSDLFLKYNIDVKKVKTGKNIANEISELIYKLEKKGFEKGKINKKNQNWVWGVNQTERMNDKDFYSVYLYHLYEIKNLGNFYGDFLFHIIESDKKKFYI
jgi:hypothetical protein